MTKTSIPRAPAAGRSLPMVCVGSLLLILLIWGSSNLVDWAATAPHSHHLVPLRPLAILHVLLGGGWLPIGLYSIWAWHPRRSHARWHRWIAALVTPFYLSGLLLLLAVGLWNALLGPPWDHSIITVIGGAYLLSWALPAISHPVATRLTSGHQAIDLALVRWGGAVLLLVVGILGASIGLQGGRDVPWILAFLAPLLALGWAQYAAAVLWGCRPWAKEEGG